MQSTQETNSLTILEQRQIHAYWPDYHDGKVDELLVFGPYYRANDPLFWKAIKTEALEHVAQNSGCSSSELVDRIRSVEGEAKAAYASETLDGMTDENFRKMLAEDGCLFLLLSFSILGAGTHLLKFPENHLVFGIGCAIKEMTNLLESMFVVGNQVPFIALEKLMELPFFQELKATKQWKQPLELEKRTLYKFLMADQETYSVDLIHCLQSVVLGRVSGSAGAIPGMLDDIYGISSAWQLSEQGVQFEKLDGELGSRRIHYNRSMLNAVLYLPVFKVDRYTYLMLECLRKYEIVQSEIRGIEPEASPYFKLLYDLIRTPQGLEVLSSRGIIQGEAEELRGLLRNFDRAEASAHLCQVRKQIIENPPLQWRKFRKLVIKFIMVLCSCLLLLFAYLQTHYTILGYYKKG